MKVAIVGAGIGGLTVAALLEEQGHEVKIFEKNNSIREVSAGIGIGDNVLKNWVIMIFKRALKTLVKI